MSSASSVSQGDSDSDSGSTTSGSADGGESLRTVLIALGANALIAVAKSVAAFVSGSASMVAEAAHSWADTGNELLLLQAERRGSRPADAEHPFGYGRAAFVWALIAGFGLFALGSVLSITHGINSLHSTEKGSDYGLAYAVLAIAFVLEGVSFVQASRQAGEASRRFGVSRWRYIIDTSDTTVRSVFLEDLAALLGIVIAAGGLALHEVTGDAVYDAVGSILVGVLLGLIAFFLIRRNAQFLVGESGSPAVRQRILQALLAEPGVEKVTFLHLEFVGPKRLLVTAAIDLAGDEREHVLAERMQQIETRIELSQYVERCLLTLSSDTDPGIGVVG